MKLTVLAASLLVSGVAFAAEPGSDLPSSAPAFATPAVPPLEAAPAKAADSAHAATPAAAATPANATQPTTAAAATDAATAAKQAKTLGYSPRTRDGKTIYCKRDASIGTKIETLKCLDEDQMTAMWNRHIGNQDSVAALQRTELYEQSRN